jgi:hypothetical protein
MKMVGEMIGLKVEGSRKRVKVTEREIQILRFINEFGFCSIQQIMKFSGRKKTRCYESMMVLNRLGLVKHKRIIYGVSGVYYVTQKGAEFTDLIPLHKISLGIYEHQLSIVDVYLKLKEQLPEFKWLSERRLLSDKYMEGLGRRGHLPDGILVFPDGKQIAIEIEITMKAKRRLEGILKGYSAQFALEEVWYFCAPDIIRTFIATIQHLPFVKVHNLKEFLK